jgi:hypothetical protein
MERLPPGHPSSPYNDDMTPKPRVYRLKDLELPLHGNEHGPNGSTSAAHEHGLAGGTSATANAAPASSNGSGSRDVTAGWPETADETSGWPGTGGPGAASRPAAADRPDIPELLGTANGIGSLLGPSGTGRVAGEAHRDGLAGRTERPHVAPGPAPGPDGAADEPYEPAGEPYAAADEPYAAAADQPYEPTGEPYEPAGEPYEPADVPYEPADEPYEPEDVASDANDASGTAYGHRRGLTAERLPSGWLTTAAADGSVQIGRAERETVAARAGTSGQGGAPAFHGAPGWEGAPERDHAEHNGAGQGWTEPEPGVDTLTQAAIDAEPGQQDDEPRTGADGSWEWDGRYLTAEECQVADEALGRCRIAEGRNVFGGYGRSGLTPAMRRIEAHIEHGGLLPDTESRALKSPDGFKRKLADLILRHPDKSADELSLEVHDGIRYTFIFEPQHYADATLQVHSRLKGHGFDLEVRRNCWQNAEYKGVNSRWRDPAHDLAFEVQFHTPASWDLLQRAQRLYEAITDPATPPAERHRMRSIYTHMSAAVPVPPGCAAIPDYRREGG